MNDNSAVDYLVSDEAFDRLFPLHIRDLSVVHFTPIHVATVAAIFLAPDPKAQVIDIGSGVGKFCLVAALQTEAKFTGIEQRKNFVSAGNKAIKQLRLTNVRLLCGNFMELDMTGYSGIYFYNSFHEQLVFDDAPDQIIDHIPGLYQQYTTHFCNQLVGMPVGTRLATYWLSVTEIPGCYKLHESHFDNLLKLWIKEF
jgi:hypothetical protein